MDSPGPVAGAPKEVSGEYTDHVSVATLIGVLLVWMPVSLFFNRLLGFGFGPGSGFGFGLGVFPLVRIVLLLMPFLGVYMIFLALNVATLALDRSGWRYRRGIFGLTLETEEGSWADITGTSFRQWLSTGRESVDLWGEFSVAGPGGEPALKVLTKLFSRGNLIGKHAVSNREIGLSVDEFDNFIRQTNRETPQLPYEWVLAQLDQHAPGPMSFPFPRVGPDRYVSVPREVQDPVADEDKADGFGGLPVPF